MRNVEISLLQRAKLLIPLWVIAACADLAVPAQAQIPPPNDSLTNAQPLVGVMGTVTGTNLNASAETGEPAPTANSPAGATIWYVWTAPFGDTIEFNTRGSTDPYGNPLPTAIAVYLSSGATNTPTFNTLVKVASNLQDTNPNFDPASRVDFAPVAGRRYFIQVDGAAGTANEGTIVLNYGTAKSSGTFGFTKAVFTCGQFDDYYEPPLFVERALPSTDRPFLQNMQLGGTPNVRVTVTRKNGATGRAEVTLTVGAINYTNYFVTNFVVTNILSTNYDTNFNELSYSNVFITNAASESLIENQVQNGGLAGGFSGTIYQTAYYDILTQLTNFNGLPSGNITFQPLGTYNVTNYFTNFPCAPSQGFPSFTTNSGITTVSVTNIYCQNVIFTNITPSAVDGVDFVSMTTNLVFDDYQMSEDVYINVTPVSEELLNLTNSGGIIFGGIGSLGGPDYPDDLGNFSYYGINAQVGLTLSNPMIDPLEDQDIVPPTIGQRFADLNILSFSGNPSQGVFSSEGLVGVPPVGGVSVGTNYQPGFYSAINFSRSTYRVNKDASSNAVFSIYDWPPPMSAMVHFTIDSTDLGANADVYNTFGTVAGSDYAVPYDGLTNSFDTNNWDFALPSNSIDGGSVSYNWTTVPVGAQVTWTMTDPLPGLHVFNIPINSNNVVEFDDDLILQMYQTSGDFQGDSSGMPPSFMGNISQANVTINFDNLAETVEPGGAVDRLYNPDGINTSQPPLNAEPGANGPVFALGIQANGESIIAGQFSAYNSYVANNIAEIQTNGFIDTSFNAGTGPNSFVSALVIDNAGRIVIAGGFTSVNGVLAPHIARLLPSGAVDTSFTPGFGADNAIRAMAVDAAGNILIGGDFLSYNTTNVNHIARLLPNGVLDTTFNAGTGTDQSVLAVATDNAGRVLIGGPFQSVNGSNYFGVARLSHSGALDTSFNIGSGADGTVYSIVVQANNEVWLAGSFPHFNLQQVGGIALVAQNGALDTSFNPGTGANGTIYSMALQPDGKVLLGGQFTSINGTRRVGVARLLSQGWVDTSFMDTAYNQFAGLINHYFNTNAYNPNDLPGPAAYNTLNAAYAIGVQADGNVLIGGTFFMIGGGNTRADRHDRQNFARLIGTPTTGLQFANGGLGNYPGNITLNPAGYSVDDTANSLFVTVVRTNGSLGRVSMVLATNTFPPGAGAAGAADFGLRNVGIASYNVIWDNYVVSDNSYGWRESAGYYGPNNNTLTLSDNQASYLSLNIMNNKAAMQNLIASLTLLQITGTNNFTLGGEPIPFGPAAGVPTSPLTIINDNVVAGTLGFSATNYGIVESGGVVTVTVLRTNGNTGQVSVAFTEQNGYTNGPLGSQSAIAGVDYVKTNGTLTFLAGQLSQSFQVKILDHSTAQSNKFFNVLLQGPTGGASLDTNVPPLVTSNTVVNIVDDHFQPGHLMFSSATYSVTKGGTATINVQRLGGGLGELSVQVAASGGTASNGVDYVWSTNETLVWNNGDISNKTFTIPTLENHIVEVNPTVNIYLTNALIGGTSPQAQTNSSILTVPPLVATLTIINDDFPGVLSFAAPLQNDLPNFNVLQDAGQVLLTVIRTNGTVGTLTANYATFNGTNAIPPVQEATAGTNYGGTNGTLVFGDGVTSRTISVPIYNYTNSGNALFDVVLYNPNPASTNYPRYGTVTILNTNLVLSPAGGVDTTTLTGLGFNDVVQSLSLQPNGALIAGGNFTAVNNFPFNRLARLNTDGSVDNSFLFNQAGADGMVRVVLSTTPSNGQTNGAIMVGGDFTHMDGTPLNGVARLNLDGSLDETFNPGAGADSSVFAIAETFLEGSVTNEVPLRYYYLAGAFANYNGQPASGIVRVYGDGSLGQVAGQIDPTFNVGQGVTGSNGTVHAMALQANGQIVIGGDFTSFDNFTLNHLARLNVDGSLDTTFNPNVGGSVRAIAIQPDGNILIGGLFTNVNGTAQNYIARLNTDGSLDTGFNSGLGCNNLVLTIALDSQTRILVGGEFTRASGVTRNGLTRLNPDGTLDPTVNFGSGANGFVQTLAVQGNDEINAGGGFTSFDGVTAGNYVRLYGGSISGPGAIQFTQNYYGVLENVTNAIITIERTGGTADTSVSVVFSTADGSGLNGLDYTSVTTNVTFPLGETFETVTVPVIDGFSISTNKVVNLLLSSPTAVGGSPPGFGPQLTSTLIITNANTGISFSAPSYRESENDPGGFAVIPIVRTGNPYSTVSVTVLTTTNGTAMPGINFDLATNTLTFGPGVETNLFLVPLIDATNQFSDVTVDLELTNAVGGFLITPSAATLDIASVNAGPGTISFSTTNYVVSEGAGTADITILRTNGVSGPVTVTLYTSNLTAQAGINYQAFSNIISFADGQSVQDVFIPIYQLSNAAPNSTVLLTLANPTGKAVIGGTNAAVLTIQNDIENVSFSSGNYFVNEGGGSVTIAILRNGPTNSPVSIGYTTSSPTNAYSTNGLAQPGVDYVQTFGTLTFTPGETLQTISIPILQGSTVNPQSPTFDVLLENPTPGVQIGVPGTAVVTILGDLSGFAFATNSYVVAEDGSNVVVTVDRFNVNTGTVTVNFTTSDQTARAGRDYSTTNGLLTFVDGQGSASFTIPILNPNVVESNLTFDVALFNPSSNSFLLSPSNVLVTITNVLTGISFSSPTYTVSECGVDAVIPVLRSGISNTLSSVTFSTMPGGTASSGTNYFPTNITLNFATNQTETNVIIQVINNHVIGPNHTVDMSLANVQGALLLNPQSAVLTIDECNGSFVVASGTALVSESVSPENGIILPSETVTIDFGLRCISGGGTTNLVATLQPGGGIANPSGAQNYGALADGGHTVFKPFTFTAAATNGQNIIATLTLQDGSRVLTNVDFGFTVGSRTVSFTNSAPIIINDSTNPPTIASPYPSIINVAGISGNIETASVTFSNFNHTYPSDVYAVLVSPTGLDSMLMGYVGGSTPAANVTLTFSQSASVSLPTNQLVSGTYLPTVDHFIPQFPFASNSLVAAPLKPYPTNLNAFAGAPTTGPWGLFIVDDKALDSGVISNGWILSLGSGIPVPENADLTATITTSPAQPTLSNLVVFTVTVTNYGPAGATNVVVSDPLPAGFLYVSNNCGCVAGTNGDLSFTVANLAVGQGVAFDIAAMPVAEGLFTNAVTVTADEADVNSNNVADAVLLVSPASADVGVNLFDSPNPLAVNGEITYTISVTNGGPSAAVNVVTVDPLPAGLSGVTISASAGTFTNVDGTVTWTLPLLAAPPGANSADMTIVGQVTTGGTLLNSITVSSDIYDPYKLNNFASVKTEVIVPTVPSLSLGSGASGYLLTWPAGESVILQGSVTLSPPIIWVPLTNPPPTVVNGQNVYPLEGSGYHFFRLESQ